ncbi:MAG: glycosyltransferase [Cytophagales bacterium]|nr:MAG: glycosyltransferase [Cytophagales bacterium]
MNISIVIPIFNEEGNIPLLYERVVNTLQAKSLSFEIIFVNDGSKDNSLEKIIQLSSSDSRVKYIDLSRNFGHQIAVSAGLNNTQGQAVVIIDADLQDPPELINELYQKYKEGFEVVYAKRKSRKGENFLKLVTAKLFYKTLRNITSIDIPLDTGDFRIIDHKVVEELRKMPEPNKFLRGQISWIGFRQTFVEYDRQERASGKTGYTYRKMIKFALDGITSFSESPLKVATVMGFVVSFAAFFMLLYAFYSRLISKDYVPGWASLIISVLFLGGIQLLSLGIIGEYISRIMSNVRKRPLYIISKSNIESAK